MTPQCASGATKAARSSSSSLPGGIKPLLPRAFEALAAALLQAGRLDEAEAQFKRALERAPDNGWSYYGLAKVYAALGDAEAAKRAEENLAKTWIGNRSLLQLSKL